MKTNSMRRSINFPKRSLTLNSSMDLNSSLHLDSSKVLHDLEDQQAICNSMLLTDRSTESGELQACDMKLAKKKMGIQLSILQKNILAESTNAVKPKRLNRSGFLKSRQSNLPYPGLNQKEGIKAMKKSSFFLDKQVGHGQKENQITSLDLQEIRRLDKDIYKLYLDLHHDYRQETQNTGDRDLEIEQLKAQLTQQGQKNLAITVQIEALAAKEVQYAQAMRVSEEEWLRKTRRQLLDKL